MVCNLPVLSSFKPANGRIVASSQYRLTESKTKYLKRVHQGESVSEIGISPVSPRASQRGIYLVVSREHEFWEATAKVMPQ